MSQRLVHRRGVCARCSRARGHHLLEQICRRSSFESCKPRCPTPPPTPRSPPVLTSLTLSPAGNFFLQNPHQHSDRVSRSRRENTKPRNKCLFFNPSEAEILNCVRVAKRVCFSGPCVPKTLKVSVCGGVEGVLCWNRD